MGPLEVCELDEKSMYSMQIHLCAWGEVHSFYQTTCLISALIDYQDFDDHLNQACVCV